jgi:aminotransferase
LWSLDQELVNKVIEMKTHTSMNTNILAQEMAFEATKTPKSFTNKQLEIWKERRDFIYKGLSAMSLDLWKPEGAFYVLPKIKNSEDFVWNMFKRYKVITYPGEWFGAKNRVRFSYALDIGRIKEGLERVKEYLKNR